VSHDHLTYADLLRIVELIKSSEQFSEFRLKVGDIEVELRRGAATPGAGPSTATRSAPSAGSSSAVAPASVASQPVAPDAPRPMAPGSSRFVAPAALEPAAAESVAPESAAPESAAPESAAPESAAPASAAPEPARGAPTWPADSFVVRSPMVGTFYRAPQPGAPPFIEVGQAVDAQDVVCIIEVMKLMNSIRAGVHGTVTHILVDDAAAVEAGQPLIVLAPSG
jgi:acetyl-CoA carboxylase biotin carboxyl carrier protein